jgi:ribonuclease-3
VWNLLKFPGLSSKKEERKLITAIQTITGFSPSNLSLYKLAILHTSRAKESNGYRESNERLEYLGDAILGAAVADYLFKKYPFKDEGFLTEIRSRIVNRDSLNLLARKMGVNHIVLFDQKNAQLQRVVLGNTLEAIVGAVYLDKGYLRCKKFVIEKLVQPHFNLELVVSTNLNYKSKLIEWTQRHGKSVRFDLIDIKKERNQKEFAIQVFVGDEPMGMGYGFTKKRAEQDAAQKSCQQLNLA